MDPEKRDFGTLLKQRFLLFRWTAGVWGLEKRLGPGIVICPAEKLKGSGLAVDILYK